MEAASGKNPVTHVGKIYNLLAGQIASEIYEKTNCFAEVKVLSQIGEPIDNPQTVNIETEAEEEKVRQIVKKKLDNISALSGKVVEGEIDTF